MQVSDAMWQAWFAGLVAEGIEDDTLALSTPNALVRERIEDRYKGLIEGVLHDTHRGVDKVRLEVRRPSAHREEYDVPRSSTVSTPSVDNVAPGTGTAGGPADHTTAASPASAPSATAPASTAASGFPPAAAPAAASTNGGRPPAPALSPRYTFDAFVIGATNRFAHAAAQRVAEKPAASYNPLFIHGDSGLGKTHLLHAIGHYVADNFPSATVRYVSTETFLNDFVDAIRTNGQFGFKRRYREIDVLLVDDIQFMEGKEGLQEEFFHTFNSLYEGERQIVLSSDRHPRNIATLEDRLRSRFEWGLITDVQPPDLETRLAILRKKAESERVPIPADVLEMIATHVKDNIRELEGALIRVSAYASLNAEPLTIAVAEQVLSDILAAGRPRQITPPVILKATSEMFELSIDEICGTSRRRPLVNARQIGMYVFRELTDMSYPAIAREFGGRDHTTVIHAVEKVSRLMMERRQTYDQVTELIRTIKGATS
jgi:chromosomal replication initiator protein